MTSELKCPYSEEELKEIRNNFNGNKLVCPFCGKKLWYDEQDGIYRCMKSGCVMDYEGGTEKLWQELIQTKKELEIAKEEIEQLENELAQEVNGASF